MISTAPGRAGQRMDPTSHTIKQKTRGPQTRFFCFVDTVSARNFAGTNDSHGWIGIRFQLQLGGTPNDILLHINMRDPSMSSGSKLSARLSFSTAFTMRRLHSRNSKIYKQGRSHDSLRIPQAASTPRVPGMENENAAPGPLFRVAHRRP
jgi:hypothetical protein